MQNQFVRTINHSGHYGGRGHVWVRLNYFHNVRIDTLAVGTTILFSIFLLSFLMLSRFTVFFFRFGFYAIFSSSFHFNLKSFPFFHSFIHLLPYYVQWFRFQFEISVSKRHQNRKSFKMHFSPVHTIVCTLYSNNNKQINKQKNSNF